MNIPYTKMELALALFSLEQKLKDKDLEKIGKEIEAKLEEKIPGENASLYMLIAKENGISVEALINSPNLKLLQAQYYDSIYALLVKEFEERLEISQKEAYALLAEAMGLLEGPLI